MNRRRVMVWNRDKWKINKNKYLKNVLKQRVEERADRNLESEISLKIKKRVREERLKKIKLRSEEKEKRRNGIGVGKRKLDIWINQERHINKADKEDLFFKRIKRKGKKKN